MKPTARNYAKSWTPKQDGNYQIEFVNSPGGKEIKATITVTNQPENKNDPLPADVRDGKGTFNTLDIKPGKVEVHKFRVKGGYAASFSVTCIGAKAGSDINLQITHETESNDVYESDNRPDANATVRFTRPDTEIILLRIENASRNVTNRCSVIFNVSPPEPARP